MPVILYWGEEDFNIEQNLKGLKSKVLDDSWSALNHKTLREPDIKNLVEAIETTPMMFGNLVIEVHSTALFLRGKKVYDESLLKRLIENIQNLNPSIYLVFVCKIERESNKKIDSVKKLVKVIKEVGEVKEFPAFKNYEEDKLIDWVKQRIKKQGVSISSQAGSLLILQAGSNLRKLDTELEKIITFIQPRKEILPEDIQELCSDTENIFRMTDFWLVNKKVQALIELKKLFEKNPPVRIIATMQSLLKRWIRIKLESKTKSDKEIAPIIKLHPYVVKMEMQKLKNIPVKQLIDFRNKLNKAEFDMKSGKVPPETSLEVVIAS